MEKHQTYIAWQHGYFVIQGNHDVVYYIYFTLDKPEMTYDAGVLYQARQQFKQYFNRERFEFSFPIKITGTSFQQDVYNQLQRVAYGTTVSYEKLGLMAGYYRASRAVGNAMGANRLMVVVPCHRVIKKNGTLGGFSGDPKLKRLLLDFEIETRSLLG